jgi:hypothetical protein
LYFSAVTYHGQFNASNKYKVTVTVRKRMENTTSVEWLSKTPQDSDVIVRLFAFARWWFVLGV